MNHTVIFFAPNGAACEQQFMTYSEAMEFDLKMLGTDYYTTSGVLSIGEDDIAGWHDCDEPFVPCPITDDCDNDIPF